jgi:hypothetical protein
MIEKSPTDLFPPEGVKPAGFPFAEGTLANWRSAGKGPPYVKLGGRVYYRRGDLEHWIASNLRNPGGRRLRHVQPLNGRR